MTRRNIVAFTAPEGARPDYISINEEPSGCVSLAARGVGITTAVLVTKEEFIKMADDIAKWRAQQ